MDPATGLASLKIDRSAKADRPRLHAGRWGAAIAVGAAIGIAYALYASGPGPITVTTAIARAPGTAGASGGAILNGSGYVTARRKATVAPPITGRVVELLVEEGQAVTAGQVLARLDDAALQAQLAVAKADLAVSRSAADEAAATQVDAERTRDRTFKLHADGHTSQQELDRDTTALALAKARAEGATLRIATAERRIQQVEQSISDCVVRAPFAGIAVTKDAQVGEIVSPMSGSGGFTRTGIATIVDMSSLEIEVDVNEDRIARVHPGQPVEAILDAHPDWKIPAKVRTIIPTADRQKATVKVRIDIPTGDPRLLPDMGVKVAFQAEAAPATAVEGNAPPVRVLVPAAAIRSDGGLSVAWLVTNWRLERRAVTAGPVMGSDLGILAGLKEGDRVVVGGEGEMGEGIAVRERVP